MFVKSFPVVAVAAALTSLAPAAAFAQQETVWVQIEAQPSIAQAEAAIRGYAQRLQDVNGFSIGGGWYAIALGPYAPEDANRVLQVLRAEGTIPRDSYVAFSTAYRDQFWPRGGAALAQPAPVAPQPAPAPEAVPAPDQGTQPLPEAAPEIAAAPEPQPVPALPDETPTEARRSEALLTQQERMDIQVALKWAGFYGSAIDGAYGRGTRASMAAWQEYQGMDVTGILTTRQRAELLRQYNAVLDGLDLRLVTDDTAGITMKLPMGVVGFDRYEAPFAHYTPTGDIDARVFLISQQGDQKTLFGLYDILQTLAVIPETGPRERRADGFTIVGENASLISHTEVTLTNGRIKGWSLVWPAGDEERRTRLLGEMQKSFQPLDGIVLPAAMGADSEQSIDLLSGLEIRTPKMSRSGFFISQDGAVLTTADAVGQCGRITIGDGIAAELVQVDGQSGAALLRPADRIAPMSFAKFATQPPRLQSDVASAGFPYEGRLTSATISFGKLEELQGLSGEQELERLSLDMLPGEAGGPVMDTGGAVIGMLAPHEANGRQLPPGVAFAVDAQNLVNLMGQAGLSALAAEPDQNLAPEDLTKIGMDMTVLVSCWE
ncbi:trypsin-like peptidase domain-containing protein [Pseudooceanicola sp. C21-150M6]|uniref:trypsin-like peptidase domain-containing protein n=1 Tax=Pseudooceanicola sp. C21-150M6 TaxID=3434355 RepID=UPI003D7FB1C6